MSLPLSFFIFHSSGECIYRVNLGGGELDISIFAGFSSSVSTFSSLLHRSSNTNPAATMPLLSGTPKRKTTHVINGPDAFCYRDTESFTLAIHAPTDTGKEVISDMLELIENMFSFLMGDPSTWARDTMATGGFPDIIEKVLAGNETAPETDPQLWDVLPLPRSVRFMPGSRLLYQQLDRILAILEEDAHTSGGMIMIGSSVLFSRLNHKNTYLVSRLVNLRPLRDATFRIVPIFSEGAWKKLVMMAAKPYLLAVMVSSRATFASTRSICVRCGESLRASDAVHLPVEESPVPIRNFAGLAVVSFLYHHIPTGFTLSPSLRSGPPQLKQKSMSTFQWFYSRTRDAVASSELREIQYAKDDFKFFYTLREEVHELYVLCNEAALGRGEDIRDIGKAIIEKAASRVPMT